MILQTLHPELLIHGVKNFRSPSNRQELIDCVLFNHKISNQLELAEDHNFPITFDLNMFFSNLYDEFYSTCKQHYKFIDSELNKKICWAYKSNESQFVDRWHTHINTSTIVGVYYLNVPNNDSCIHFRHNEEQYTLPVENDDLIIFPNYLFHTPGKSVGDEYRVSINMEIICDGRYQQ